VTKYPRAAGAALYVHRAFHVGILSFMVTIAVMASGVTSASFAATRVGGRYWTGVFGTENPPTVLIGILVILLVAAVNYRGVGESIEVNIAITLIELSGLVFIILVGAKVLLSGDGNPGQAFEFKESGFGALTGITAGAAPPSTPSSASRTRSTWPRRSATRSGRSRRRCSPASSPPASSTC
jgi:amino acid transporter